MIGTGGNEQLSLLANVSGELFDLPAGPVYVAAGYENRKDKGWRNPDSLVIIGAANTNAADPISGTVKSDEFYVEASLPLLADVPLAESVNLDLAFRYSDYETFGTDDNYKIGLNWQIVEDLKVRANLSTAFRVPNVNELFGGVAEGNLTTTDPCSGWSSLDPSDIVYQNCQADGVPAGFMQLGNTILTTVGGNPALEPESADTFTLGVVYQPSFLEGLALTLDYFDIEIDDAITQIPGSTKLEVCYNTPNLAHEFCSPDHFTRSSLSGDVNFLSAQPVNTGLESITGVDFGLTYDFDIMDLPTTFDFKTTVLDEYEVTPFDGAAPIVLDGHIGGGNGGYSKYRSYLSLNVGGDRWTGNYSVQIIGEGDDFNFEPPAIGAEIDTVVYHYAQASYRLSESARIAVGIDNIFDEDAPYVASWTDGNTDTMTYDLTGRRAYARLTYRWQ
jgi:outer membrane receptor protein involved in Fe transport